jgi:hypothetical protein
MTDPRLAQYEAAQRGRHHLLSLLGGETGIKKLGIVAISTNAGGLRLLFGPPHYPVVDVTMRESKSYVLMRSPSSFSWLELTETEMVATLNRIAAPCRAWAKLSTLYRPRGTLIKHENS